MGIHFQWNKAQRLPAFWEWSSHCGTGYVFGGSPFSKSQFSFHYLEMFLRNILETNSMLKAPLFWLIEKISCFRSRSLVNLWFFLRHQPCQRRILSTSFSLLKRNNALLPAGILRVHQHTDEYPWITNLIEPDNRKHRFFRKPSLNVFVGHLEANPCFSHCKTSTHLSFWKRTRQMQHSFFK